MTRLATFIALLLALAMAPATAQNAAAPSDRDAVTILVSIDGLRPDYLDRGSIPNLSRLRECKAAHP